MIGLDKQVAALLGTTVVHRRTGLKGRVKAVAVHEGGTTKALVQPDHLFNTPWWASTCMLCVVESVEACCSRAYSGAVSAAPPEERRNSIDRRTGEEGAGYVGRRNLGKQRRGATYGRRILSGDRREKANA